MYSRKGLRQRMEPWGTPAFTGYSWKGVSSRTTWSRLLLRKDKVSSKNWSKDPWDLSLKRRIACQTLTKALNISIFTAVVVPDLLVPSDTTLERPAVDWQELKPK